MDNEYSQFFEILDEKKKELPATLADMKSMLKTIDSLKSYDEPLLVIVV